MMDPSQFPAVKASPGVIYVPDDYSTIQEAIYNAILGDEIIVRAGTYYENLIVNQTVTLTGENKFTTIIDGEAIDNVVTFKNISITMRGFTIRNGNNFSGIAGDQFDGHTISDNIFLNNAFGVKLLMTSGNTVVDNTFIDNSLIGIHVVASSGNNISNNYVYRSTYGISSYGIKLEGSDSNYIINNTVSDTSYGIYLHSSNFATVDNNKVSAQTAGIYFAYSSDGNVRHNMVSDCNIGIELYGGTRNNVFNNTIFGLNSYGIYLVYSTAGEIDSNLVSNNGWGIYFFDSDNNLVVYNVASYNAYGIYLTSSSTGSSIYKNNFLENTMQVFQHGNSPNTWYTSAQGKDYGNYWSDYLGEDTDGDGVGDSPADSIPHWIVDYYPLMDPTVIAHDTAITNVETSSTTVYQGEVVDIIVVARNEGTVNETFNVTAKYFNRIIETQTVTNLTRYGSTTLVFNWDTTGVPTGFDYEIKAEASPVTGETDKEDNIFIDGTITVETISTTPVASFTFSPLTPYAGEIVTFDGTASYDPNGYIDSYLWDFGDGTNGTGEIATHSFADNGTYTVALTVTDSDGLTNTTSADVTVHIIEILGDINGDGAVNIDDLVLLTQAFGSTPTSPNWNSDADLNEDNLVNALDLYLVGKSYDQTP